MTDKYNILVDLSKLKNLYCGLGQVSMQFGKALVENCPAHIQLNFLIPHSFVNTFGAEVIYEIAGIKRQFFPFISKKYDLWHSIHQDSPYFPSSKKTPYLLTIHDLNFLAEKNPQKASRRLDKIQRRINQACAITTVSEFTENQVKKHLSINSKSLSIIYNGIEKGDFINEKKPDFDITSKFLFTIGVVRPKKNFHVLVDFLNLLPEYSLVIAGDNDDPYGEFILNRCKELNIDGRVILPGKISDEEKKWLYNHSEAFVFPSLHEGFGLPVIEAMNAGKPVFLSQLSSLPEIGGKEAFYWEKFEPEYMAEVFISEMEKFRKDPEKTNSIKSHADKFSWHIAAKQYFSLYSQILVNV